MIRGKKHMHTKRILLACFLCLFWPMFSYPQKGEKFLDDKNRIALKTEIEQILIQYLEQKRQRRGILLEVKVCQTEKELSFSLGTRSQREIIFSLLLEDKGEKFLIGKGQVPSLSIKSKIEHAMSQAMPSAKTIMWHWKVGPIGWGVVVVPCTNLYVRPIPEMGDNLASQVLYGTPVTLWEATQDKQFFLAQNQYDGYVAWIEGKSLELETQETWETWANMPKFFLSDKHRIFFPGTGVGKLSEKSAILFPAQEILSFASSPFSCNPTRESIVSTARQFLSDGSLGPVTYLWGGSCIPQLDCSGFVQLVFRMHGILLPRDSDQQLQYCQEIPLDHARPGDLIFFSKHKRHPTHVGIHLGNSLYIHCSPAGESSGVKINSLTGQTDYEKALMKMYYASGRISLLSETEPK